MPGDPLRSPTSAHTPDSVVEDEELAAAPATTEIDFDSEEILEEVEQLLREAAPHDYDVLVVGGGPGGYACALCAAELGASVALIEAGEIGGLHLRSGIPAKAMASCAHVLRLSGNAPAFGIHSLSPPQANFDVMLERARSLADAELARIETQLAQAGVEVIKGFGKFAGTHTLEVEEAGGTRSLRAVNIVLAVGSRPSRPAFPGHDLPGVLTPDEIWRQINAPPPRLVILGADSIALELGSLLAALGSKVTFLEPRRRILRNEDEDIALEMARLLERDGMDVITRAQVRRIETAAPFQLIYSRDGHEYKLETDCILPLTGREANTRKLGLEKTEVVCAAGKIHVDEFHETAEGGIYAVGDCIRGCGSSHLAQAEGRMVAERICTGSATTDLNLLPICCFSHPAMARVGVTLTQAKKNHWPAISGIAFFEGNTRAKLAGCTEGFVKVVLHTQTSRLLGCQIIGECAPELINHAMLIMAADLPVDQWPATLHSHPSLAQCIPAAAKAARKSRPGR